MVEINFGALKERVMKAAKVDKLDEETEIYIRFYCWGTTALNCEWILGEYSISPRELARMHETALPKPLHKYLY